MTAQEFDLLQKRASTKTNPKGWLLGRRRLRAAVWDKTGGLCWYCGNPTNPYRDFSVDHFVPVKNGGAHLISNLVPSCRRCNGLKGCGSLEELRQKLGAANRPKFSAEQRRYLSSLEIRL